MNIAFVTTTGNNSTAQVGNAGKPYLTIQAAINALHAIGGGNVMIDFGTYDSPTTFYSNIRLVGAGLPKFNADVEQSTTTSVTYEAPTALVGGTILKNGLAIADCENVGVCNLGIDVGSGFFPAGSTKNGLAIYRTADITGDGDTTFTVYNQLKGTIVRDVTILMSSPSVLFHGFITEGLHGLYAENVTTWGGTHGHAHKDQKSTFRNLVAYECATDGLIIKSNNYALCNDVLVDGFRYIKSSTDPATAAIVIQNKSTATPMDNIVIQNCDTGGATKAFKSVSDFGAIITRASLVNIKSSGTFDTAALASSKTFFACFNSTTPITS